MKFKDKYLSISSNLFIQEKATDISIAFPLVAETGFEPMTSRL